MADFMSGLLGLGNEDDPMQRAKQAGLLGLGTSLLQAGAPSLTPTSLGAALGQGIMSGQQASGQAMQQARQRQIQKEIMGTMGGASGAPGDVQARIDLLRKMALLDPKNATTYLKLSEQMAGKAPVFTGEVANAALTLFGTNDVSKLTPEQRQQAAQAAEQAKIRAARAGAPSVNVNYERTFGTQLAAEQIKDLSSSNTAAQAANSTLNTIANLEPVLEAGVFSGPGSSVQILVAQIGQRLGVGGANQADVLQNTASAMQSIAQLELNAASQMRGQGTLTDAERGILRRAAAGELTKLTAAEVKTLVGAIKKNSLSTIGNHNRLIDNLSKIQPDAKDKLNVMRVTPITPTNTAPTRRQRFNPATGQLEDVQ